MNKFSKWYILAIMLFLCLVIMPVTFSKYSTKIRTTITLNARQPEYTIVFNSNEPVGSATGTMTNQLFIYGVAQDLNANNFSVNDYIFYEWNTQADGLGIAYSDKENILNLSSVDGDVIDLYAQWRDEIITIEPPDGTTTGEYILNKVKTLANNNTAISNPYTYVDTNITAFKRATKAQYNSVKSSLTTSNTISVSSSICEMYMWFDDTTGTIYYYTEADKVAISGNAQRMFARMYNLTDISGLTYFDMSNTTDMNRMFQNCHSLDDLSPLADWDVSNVTNMNYMFGSDYIDSSSPKSLFTDLTPLANWDVSNVTNMDQMFKMTSVNSVEPIKNWDVSKVTTFKQMFNRANLTTATSLSIWNPASGTNFDMFFANMGMSTNNMPIFQTRPGTWDSSGKYFPTN